MATASSHKVYHLYKAPATSYEAVVANLGILEPGRYRGFDGMMHLNTLGSIISVSLTHNLTGIVKVDSSGAAQPVNGVVMMKQGTVIHFQGGQNVAVNNNSGNAFERWDLIVLQYQYIPTITGGGSPILVAIQGPNGGPALPALSAPNIQVPIGIIKHTANGAAYSSLTYEYLAPPKLANHLIDILENYSTVLDGRYAQLAAANDMSGLNNFIGEVTVQTKKLNQKSLVENTMVSVAAADVMDTDGLMVITETGGNVLELDMNNSAQVFRGFKYATGMPAVGTTVIVNFINVEETQLAPFSMSPVLPGFLSTYINDGSGINYISDGPIAMMYMGLSETTPSVPLFRVISWPELSRRLQSLISGLNSSLTGLIATKANTAQPAWVNVTYYAHPAAWSDFDTVNHGLQYRLNTLGELELRGAFKKSGTIYLSDTIITVLPIGYRPTKEYRFFARHTDGAYPNTIIDIRVHTNGNITATSYGDPYLEDTAINIPGTMIIALD